jgi:hypothetical protein
VPIAINVNYNTSYLHTVQIPKGSSVYACAVAKKLLEAVEMKNQALKIFN